MKNEQSTIISRDGDMESMWQKIPDNYEFDTKLKSKNVFDVLIVGAGITGITTALLLQKAGKKCIVAEAHAVGFGTTSGTSAHINTFFDATYPEVESDFGAENAWLFAKAGKEAMSTIVDFINKLDIDCDLESKKGYLFSLGEKQTKELKEILISSQKAGIAVFETDENGVPIPFDYSIQFENQGQFHPIKYLEALAKEFINLGGIIVENTPINNVSFVDGHHTAETSSNLIKAKNLVYATHIPPGINAFSFRCAPYRSYVLGIKLKDNNYPDCLAYDMVEPYHYFRSHVIDNQKYLILGGEDHKTGQGDPDKAFENLENYAKQYFNVESIDYKWSAQYYVPVDGLPYIGEMPIGDNTYMATGFNGNGMTFGTLSGKIISDQILGNENPYIELFKPSRMKPVAGFTEFVKENANVAYHFIADRFNAEEVESLKTLKPEEGIVADYRNKKIAIYKDINGKIHALSPTCTHAGCIVNFNAVEKSWDCPCHGGRFDIDGKVITGPPQKDLESIEVENL